MDQRLFILPGIVVLTGLGILAASPQESASPKTPNPAEAARLNNIGAAYMNQQLFEKGLKAFEDAAALDPKLQIAKLNQGIALLNLGRVDQAKQFLEDASRQDPKNPHAWYNLGLFYKNTSDVQAAIAAFRRVTEIDANDADTWYFLGAAYAQNKQFAQAIDAFEHALKLNPLHASAEFGTSRAYQQSGDTEHAREHLQRFQHITQEKLGAPLSLAYGEQGQYSRAEESPGAVEKAPAPIPVKFVNANRPAGLATKTSDSSRPFLVGTGACFLDYDSDGRVDLLLPDAGKSSGMSLYHNLGQPGFEDVTKKAGLDPSLHAFACAAADYDNDGGTDLAVSLKLPAGVLLFHNEKTGKFRDVTNTAGIKGNLLDRGMGGVFEEIGITFIDYDHDGDLDLYLTAFGAGIDSSPETWSERIPRCNGRMWRNNGNGTFTDVTGSLGLCGPRQSIAGVGTDYNNDRAVDLLVAGSENSPLILENPREGTFSARQPWTGLMPEGSVGATVLDFNHDGWMDLALTHSAAPGLTLWRNNLGRTFDPVPLPATNWVRGFGLAAFDYDNDGWVDLIAVGETKEGKGEVRLFRNLGPDGWKDITSDVGLDKIALKDPRAVITGDYDNDGATDLLITQNHGPAVLLRNEGGNKNNWLRLNLKGLADNKSAIGTKVEVFAGGNRQKFEIAGSSGYLGQNSPYLTIGLGQAKQADVVRLLWPTGVLQDEIEVAGGKEQAFTEIDRRGSSCPTLFVWDGDHYELVADIIGAGVVGHWVGPGQRNIPRPTEYIKLDRNMVRVKENPHPVAESATRVGHPTLSFRLMEPMEEVVYLDQVKLLAVDHPADFDVFPDEYFASNPPYPEFKVVASRDARPPAGAWDEHGHDVLPDILAHRYFGDFELLPFKGFTKLHSLELDLGDPYRGGPLWLLLHGEIEYFTATGMYAADQAGIQGIAPYVEALGADGKWVKVVEDMGFPAGGPRTMTADLTGKLPPGTQRIRISTNLQIYWDNILINRFSEDQNVRLTPVPLASADLRFHGYPRQIEDKPPGVVKYVYEQVSRTGPYARQSGTYTRYGDVRALLTDFDDHLAVFGSGEEVALEFDPSQLPALPKGWARDYFFLANGYEKDMDFYAFEGSTVEPLPFRAMGTYPYPRNAFPLDDSHLRYLLEYNTRHVSGNEPQGYWYNYSGHK